MVLNYFKTGMRNLKRNISHTFINILGLSLGMAVFIIILQFVLVQKSYDKFHANHENIYRVATNTPNGNSYAKSYGGLSEIVKSGIPEIESIARIDRTEGLVMNDGIQTFEDKVYEVDPSFVDIFDFPVIEGSTNGALTNNKIIISDNIKNKYFRDGSCINKTFDFDETVYTIAAVVDVPENSHLKFDALIPTTPTTEYDLNNLDVYTYLSLKNKDISGVEGKLNSILKSNCKEENCQTSLFLQPLGGIYLTSNLNKELGVNGSSKDISYLFFFALLVLIVAWFNYISLSTVGAINRSREIGTRLALGASRGNLVSQFLVESSIVNFIVFFITILLAFMGAKFINSQMGITMSDSIWSSPLFWGIYISIIVLGVIVSSIYPALVISGFNIVNTMKEAKSSMSGKVTRKLITSIQFVITIFLIATTLIAFSQMNYIRNQDLGININDVIVLNIPESISDKKENINSLKGEFLNNPAIKKVAVSSLVPGTEYNFVVGDAKKNELDTPKELNMIWADYDFAEVFEIEIVQGANKLKELKNIDKPVFLLNEAGAKKMAINNVEENEEVMSILGGNEVLVAGVFKNFYQKTAKFKADPLLIGSFPLKGFPVGGDLSYLIRVDGTDSQAVLASIESKWKNFFPEVPLDYLFLDEKYNQLYAQDEQLISLFSIFTLLAIIISTIGLFALTLFIAQQRRSEVAVRKVNGATAFQIVGLFIKDTSKLIIIAFLIASPIVYYVIGEWLANFTIRVGFEWWWYATAGGIVFLIAALIVGYQSSKIAKVNPSLVLMHN